MECNPKAPNGNFDNKGEWNKGDEQEVAIIIQVSGRYVICSDGCEIVIGIKLVV